MNQVIEAGTVHEATDIAFGKYGFLRSKLSPIHGEAANWLLYDREDYVGQKVTPLSSLTNLTTPLGGRELVRDAKTDPGKAAFAYFLNFWGIGSQQYEDRKKSGGLKGLSGLEGLKGL